MPEGHDRQMQQVAQQDGFQTEMAEEGNCFVVGRYCLIITAFTYIAVVCQEGVQMFRHKTQPLRNAGVPHDRDRGPFILVEKILLRGPVCRHPVPGNGAVRFVGPADGHAEFPQPGQDLCLYAQPVQTGLYGRPGPAQGRNIEFINMEAVDDGRQPAGVIGAPFRNGIIGVVRFSVSDDQNIHRRLLSLKTAGPFP